MTTASIVPFHLRRSAKSAPASALLISTDRADELLGFIAGSSTAHRVSGGFLVVLGPDAPPPPPGPIRLRSLAHHLYLPADGELVPRLLDDEAAGLTRTLGLIFLPGGRVLSFDPREPVMIGSLLVANRREATAWRPFPPRPSRAERLREIVVDRPDPMADDEPIDIAPGEDPEFAGSDEPGAEGEDDGKKTADPELAGGPRQGGSVWEGIKGLAGAGADWLGRASGRVPKLTEAILRRQERAVRSLIRRFREGDVEGALRHALPLTGCGRGSVPSTDARLPRMDPGYSLRSLLKAGLGPVRLWFGGGPDLKADLAREYRKAAEEAERRGDFRRAATIFGRLLGDVATAAHLLDRAGLHRDAAALYLDRLGDVPAAARSFESAGEVDRALALYRQSGMNAEAGDLLRRAGDEEAATLEYLQAASKLADGPKQGRLAAGDLLRDRAGLPDLALEQYARGWSDRPAAHAVPCALRMAALHADRGEAGPILRIVDEAESLFEGPGQDAPAVDFYNELARLADRGPLILARDDLRDRALMGLAARLRRSIEDEARPGPLTSNLLGRTGLWPADLVSDAARALEAAAALGGNRRRLAGLIGGMRPEPEFRRIPVPGGRASCVAWSESSGEAFLGFEEGEVYRVDLARSEVARMADFRAPVSSIAADPDGRTVVLMTESGQDSATLSRLSRAPGSTGWTPRSRRLDGPGEKRLTPIARSESARAFGVWDGDDLLIFEGEESLEAPRRLPVSDLNSIPSASILIPGGSAGWSALVAVGSHLLDVNADGDSTQTFHLGWCPASPEGRSLRSVPDPWHPLIGSIGLAGVDVDGAARWSELSMVDGELRAIAKNLASADAHYVAATLARAGLVAAVSSRGVAWLRCGPRCLTPDGSTPLPIPGAVACFTSPRTGELMIVDEDGTLTCVPLPP